MNVDFKLEEHHELILRILYEAKEMRYKYFEKIYGLLRENELTIPGVVALLEKNVKLDQSGSELAFDFGRFALPKYELVSTVRASRSLSQLEREIAGLHFIGLVEVLKSNSTPYSSFEYSSGLDKCSLRLSEEGTRVAKRVSEGRRLIIRPKPASRNTVFVACAFGKDGIEEVYSNCLSPACSGLGYDPVRVDLAEPPQTVTEAIVDSISKSACVIADLTYARPSVYFEVGFAHGLGVPLLLTCRSDHHRSTRDELRIHFDLEQFKISFWSRKAKNRFSWPRNMSPSYRLKQIVPSRTA